MKIINLKDFKKRQNIKAKSTKASKFSLDMSWVLFIVAIIGIIVGAFCWWIIFGMNAKSAITYTYSESSGEFYNAVLTDSHGNSYQTTIKNKMHDLLKDGDTIYAVKESQNKTTGIYTFACYSTSELYEAVRYYYLNTILLVFCFACIVYSPLVLATALHDAW